MKGLSFVKYNRIPKFSPLMSNTSSCKLGPLIPPSSCHEGLRLKTSRSFRSVRRAQSGYVGLLSPKRRDSHDERLPGLNCPMI